MPNRSQPGRGGGAGRGLVHAATEARAGNSPGARYSRQYLAQVQEQAQPGAASGRCPERCARSSPCCRRCSRRRRPWPCSASRWASWSSTSPAASWPSASWAWPSSPRRCCWCSSPAPWPTGWTVVVLPRSPSGSRRSCSRASPSTSAPTRRRRCPIFLLVIGYGTARAFATPATRSLPADTVDGVAPPVAHRPPGRHLAGRARCSDPCSVGSSTSSAPWVPFATAVVLVVIAAVTVLTVRVRPYVRPAAPTDEDGVEHSGMHQAMEGLRFVRSRPILLGAISLDLFAVLFGGAVALLPAIAEDRLGVGAVGLGWLRAATGIGAGIGRAVPHVRSRSAAASDESCSRASRSSASARSCSASPRASPSRSSRCSCCRAPTR